ncbi:MAG: zinc metallopeptidase [Gammaproteobacteria bacterium]|nr:zinc metallopeptidase [Gammaproteobacteria bacterium]
MRWKKGRRSGNVEDRRGSGGGSIFGGGGGGGRGLKVSGGVAVVLVLAVFLLGGDPAQVIGMLTGGGGPLPGGGGATRSQPAPSRPADLAGDEEAQFISVVLADTEDTWKPLFREMGKSYREPRLVLFSNMVQSACGMASAASGPFYCPPDGQVYIDLAFFRELRRLGAAGDFARAYVLAHEVGHHVQNLLGISERVRSLQARASKRDANALSVLTELQADCLAGVWAHHGNRERKILEPGDLEEGLAAAAAVGDDRLMRRAGRGVSPESFTHGSSEQRVHWFRTGFRDGRVSRCDTFGAAGAS